MEDFDLNIVARKSVKSLFALVSRTFLIQILSIITSLVLTIFLSPENFGVFFIVSSLVIFLNYFSDIGLAASLIQKRKEPTVKELRTVFTVQQVLVLIIIIPLFVLSPKIATFFHLGIEGLYLIYAFLASFLLSSLKTIPTILLERRLEFHRLVIPQIVENLVYNLALIYFVISGYGVNSFTIAVVLRGIVGLIAIYAVQRWPIGIAFDAVSFKALISFGLPFQANSLLAMLKDDLINVYVGRALPLSQVGYIGFAQKWAFLPLRLFLDNVMKIIFPSFSRLQYDKEALRVVLEKSLFMISFFILPSAVIFIMMSPLFIEHIPKYAKWEPAILSLVFFSLNTVFGALSSPLTNFLNAIGKVKITLYFMTFWTILIWVLTPVLIKYYGYNGVAIASMIVALSTFSIIPVVRRYLEFSFIAPIYKQAVAALGMGAVIYLTSNFVTSLPTLLIEIIFSGTVYLIVAFILAKKEMMGALRFARSAISK